MSFFNENKIENLGDYIKVNREKLNLTIPELAKMLNISKAAISQWENNIKEPSILNLTHLSNIFEVSFDELLSFKTSSYLNLNDEYNFRNLYFNDDKLLKEKLNSKLRKKDFINKFLNSRNKFEELLNLFLENKEIDVTLFNSFIILLKPKFNNEELNLKNIKNKITKENIKNINYIINLDEEIFNILNKNDTGLISFYAKRNLDHISINDLLKIGINSKSEKSLLLSLVVLGATLESDNGLNNLDYTLDIINNL